MGREALERVQQRDRILALLRYADGFPMTTSEIRDAVGRGGSVYPDLCILKRRGLIGSDRFESSREIAWRLVR